MIVTCSKVQAKNAEWLLLATTFSYTSVPASGCFAIGDSFNDLGMLSTRHAGMIACPINAVAEIRTAVGSSNGYITKSPHGMGVVEALRHFFPSGN